MTTPIFSQGQKTSALSVLNELASKVVRIRVNNSKPEEDRDDKPAALELNSYDLGEVLGVILKTRYLASYASLNSAHLGNVSKHLDEIDQGSSEKISDATFDLITQIRQTVSADPSADQAEKEKAAEVDGFFSSLRGQKATLNGYGKTAADLIEKHGKKISTTKAVFTEWKEMFEAAKEKIESGILPERGELSFAFAPIAEVAGIKRDDLKSLFGEKTALTSSAVKRDIDLGVSPGAKAQPTTSGPRF